MAAARRAAASLCWDAAQGTPCSGNRGPSPPPTRSASGENPLPRGSAQGHGAAARGAGEESPSEAPGRSSSHFPHLFADGEKGSFWSSSLRKLGFLLSEFSARKGVEFSCLACRAAWGGKPTRQQASTLAPKEQCKGSSKVTALLAWPCSLYCHCNPLIPLEMTTTEINTFPNPSFSKLPSNFKSSCTCTQMPVPCSQFMCLFLNIVPGKLFVRLNTPK